MNTNHSANDNGRDALLPKTPVPLARQRWRRWILLTIPLLAGALSISVARAHGPGGGDVPREGRMGAFMQERMESLLTAAGATDAQKAQIKAIWEPLQVQLRTLHKQEGDIRHQMGELLAAATIDTARVEQVRQQSVQTLDKISAAMTQGMISSARVLTPEQRKIVVQKIEEHRGHHPESH